MDRDLLAGIGTLVRDPSRSMRLEELEIARMNSKGAGRLWRKWFPCCLELGKRRWEKALLRLLNLCSSMLEIEGGNHQILLPCPDFRELLGVRILYDILHERDFPRAGFPSNSVDVLTRS